MAARSFLVPINLNQLEVQNPRYQQLASDPSSPSPVEGQFWYRTDLHRERLYDGTAARSMATLSDTLDEFGAPAATVSWNSQSLTNLAAPVNPGDAVNKAYVDAAISNLDYHEAARYMAVAALPAYTYSNGSSGVGATITANAHGVWTIDGQTLTVGDRVLLPDKYGGSNVAAAASDAGIYTVTVVGTSGVSTVLTRALDFNTATANLIGTIAAGAAIFVVTGTAAAGSSWIMTQESAITVGSTSLTWTQMGAAGSYSAGSGGALTLTGSAFSVNVDGVTIAINGSNELIVDSSGTEYQVLLSSGTAGTAPSWGALPLGQSAAVSGQLAIANGGTGASSASAGLAALGGTPLAYTATVGDGTNVAYTITHGLPGGRARIVVVYLTASPYSSVEVDWAPTTTTTITLNFATPPSSGQYTVVVL